MKELIDNLRKHNVDYLVGDARNEDTVLKYSTHDNIKIEITYHRDRRLFSVKVAERLEKNNVNKDDMMRYVNLFVFGLRHSKGIR